MNNSIAEALGQIAALPHDWHGVGTMSGESLWALASHAERIGQIRYSAETGSGKTTLLFSHLSANHLVFAIDEGNSVTQVRNSPLLNRQSVTFIEGLTQKTLPVYEFRQKLQIALIDGPHGYPFPDLEYFYLCPHIETGGLLLVDDIKIPSIRRMFEILAADDMFHLLEVVDENLAFFQRTEAPSVSLTSDSWWRQGYNRPYYDQIATPCPAARQRARRMKWHRFVSRLLPKPVKSLVPGSIKQRIWKTVSRRR